MPEQTPMHLDLPLSAPWAPVRPGPGEALAFTHPALAIRVATTPLYDRFAPPLEPLGGTEIDLLSTAGWPVRMVEHVADGTRRVELRFAVLEYGGAVIISGPDDAVRAHRDELIALAKAARLDAGDVPVCVADVLA